MPNSNRLYEIQERLFGKLEVNIIENPKNPDKITFKRVMKKFLKEDLYFEYSLKNNVIHKIYQDRHEKGMKLIYRNNNISDSHELNKYNPKK